MKTARKAILAALCVCLLVLASVMGTLAYLTDDDTVVNTFTVGNVQIKLDEAPVGEDGKEISGDRVKENKYHLLPGQTYDKDPMVTVLEGSEEAYVRMLVKVSDIAKLKAAFPQNKYPTYYNNGLFLLQNLVTGWDATKWEFYGANANGDTYEFRYHTTVDGFDVDGEGKEIKKDDPLEALFTNIVIPGTVNNTELENLQNVTITATAHAIQKAGFNTAEAAWTAFNGQHNIITPPTNAITQ